MDDTRIIDFSSDNSLTLPPRFLREPNKSMIYAAGDFKGGYMNLNSRSSDTSNIEFLYVYGYNIFCCIGGGMDATNINILYLQANPHVNVVLCLLTGDNARDFTILRLLFHNMISLLDTDDLRFYPNSETVFDILRDGGVCVNLHERYILGQPKNNLHMQSFMPFDNGWGEPNFTIQMNTGWTYVLQKGPATVFTRDTDMSRIQGIQSNRNAKLAANIQSGRGHRHSVKRKTKSKKKSMKRRK